LPVTKNDGFDLSAQKEIVEKYRKIEQIKYNILDELENLKNTMIEIM
jgi:hypothetical protein